MIFSNFFKMIFFIVILLFIFELLHAGTNDTTDIPLPEHPRPDFQRQDWINLNGVWKFQFDKNNIGRQEKWFDNPENFVQKIVVPFPWGSKLSNVKDEADIAWYTRSINLPQSWQGQRVFLIIGASDWHTTAWLDGHLLGEHRGGYTPFEFELTPYITYSQSHQLVIRVDDSPHPFKLFGKQGYGNARGIWQTVYLEARPRIHLKHIFFLPDIDREKVVVRADLDQTVSTEFTLKLHFKNGDLQDAIVTKNIPNGKGETEFEIKIPNPHLWSLEDPFLYEVDVILNDEKENEDQVSTYFGMRKIGVMNLRGTDFPYIALNNKPIYLQMALDQAYHPDGYYTYPSNEFMRDEILRSRRIGLNGQRIHVKIDIPRKLYWADRLGVLIMSDIPNSWGEPDADMRRETENALRGMIQRDFNHPSIFSWVLFNETWGLKTKDKGYTLETQDWVASMYRLAKQLDPTRLVEDNSPNKRDHVITDINSWHAYLPGYAWTDQLNEISQNTYPGSKWNFIGERSQSNQPLLNSECGNVWGYKGSTGDVDWSWDYHRMINEFRRHPKICGWLYTEHHDVINEWNGYYRYDRSEKITGLSDIVPGMILKDLHSPVYLTIGEELCQEVKPGTTIEVPLWISLLTDVYDVEEFIFRYELHGWDRIGQYEIYSSDKEKIRVSPWQSKELDPLKMQMPQKPCLAILAVFLEDESGTMLHRNFTTFLVADGLAPREEIVSNQNRKLKIIRFAPASFSSAKWSLKQWNIFDGLKVNGAGSGYFEYQIPLPEDLDLEQVEAASFRIEVSAKQLFGKDQPEAKIHGDYMRGGGTHDPGLNPNAYPMTDQEKFPTAVRIRVAGQSIGTFDLPDDSADHRGILSWYAQKRDRTLHEAGSYGYLVSATIPKAALQKAAKEKKIILRFEVDDALPGGLAIYGERFGRYPLDPTIVFVLDGK